MDAALHWGGLRYKAGERELCHRGRRRSSPTDYPDCLRKRCFEGQYGKDRRPDAENMVPLEQQAVAASNHAHRYNS